MQELRLALLAGLLAVTPATPCATPRIHAELAPLAWLAARITGDPENTGTLVPPGHSPELYAPTPHQVAEALKADLYLRCGILSADGAWVAALKASKDGPRILECCKPLGADPHAWTDPLQAMKIAGWILEALLESSAATQAVHYRRNHRALERELQVLDQRIAELLEPLPRRHFLVAHPAWGAFAARYGLTQVSLGSLHAHGAEPGPRRIASVIALGRTHDVRAVFVQPGFENRSARTVAEALAIPVRTLDALNADYATNQLHVAEQLARTLR